MWILSKHSTTVTEKKLMEIRPTHGVPKKIVDANIHYKDTVVQVITPDGKSELFEVIVGVLQGDTLALFLFIIALDYALREVIREKSISFMLKKRQVSRESATFITDTDFAYDLALLSNQMEQAQFF